MLAEFLVALKEPRKTAMRFTPIIGKLGNGDILIVILVRCKLSTRGRIESDS